MLKAVFIDYSNIDSMESMLAYWLKLIKYFEAASSGDSFISGTKRLRSFCRAGYAELL